MRLLSLLDVEKEEEEIHKQAPRERELHESAMKGSVPSLLSLLHEDPSILDTINPSPLTTPLHVAALLGHLDFAKQLLTRSPELAGKLNNDGSSAIHLASAKGYVEIVKELALVNRDVCFVLDGEGRSPLHLAAIKGRVGVLTELVRVNPEAIRALTRGGETCLHLCVNYNRLEALKVLIESVKEDNKFVNWKDECGNTILHLAVARKQLEIIKYLLINTTIEVNTRNANGFTALDILSQGPRDIRDMAIKHFLTHHNPRKSTPNLDPPKSSSSITQPLNKHKHHTDWLGRQRSALMIVASLIATVAFQSALSPPGGIWQDEYKVDMNGNPVNDPHDVGKSVLAYKIPIAYGQFMIFNTIAFLSSLSIILLQVSGLPIKRRRWMWTQMVTMWIAMTAQTITYFIAFIQLTPDRNNDGMLREVTKIAVLGWLSVMGIVFIGNVIRVVRYFLRKYRHAKDERESLIIEGGEKKDEL